MDEVQLDANGDLRKRDLEDAGKIPLECVCVAGGGLVEFPMQA